MELYKLNKMLENEFARKRLYAERVAAQNLKRAMKCEPFFKLKKLEKEITFDLAKKASLKNKDKLEIASLKSSLKEVREKQVEVLEMIGLSEKDLEPKFECKICNDTGKVGGQNCECYRKRMSELLTSQCGLQKDELFDFLKFDESVYENATDLSQATKLKTMLENWCKEFPHNKKCQIVLSGETGVGKTFFAKCVSKTLLETGHSVCFVSAFEFNNILLKYHTTFGENKLLALVPLLDSEMLVIDDLGTEPIINNVTINYLYLVLSEREKSKKATLITTNLDAAGLLERYGERIYSRLADKNNSALFALHGNDIRTKKR